MSFVRAKEIPPRSGNWYDYEVKTVHEGGKVRQKVIRYIGKSGKSTPGLIGDTGLQSSPITSPVMPVNQVSSEVACKHCQSQNVMKYGTVKGVQRYWCKDCERTFVNNGLSQK